MFITHETKTDRQTDEETRPFIRFFVCPLCLSGGSILYGARTAMLHRNLNERVTTIREQPINTRIFEGQLIIRKISINLCHQMSHFKAKMNQFRFLASVPLSRCSFVRLCIRWSLTQGEGGITLVPHAELSVGWVDPRVWLGW